MLSKTHGYNIISYARKIFACVRICIWQQNANRKFCSVAFRALVSDRKRSVCIFSKQSWFVRSISKACRFFFLLTLSRLLTCSFSLSLCPPVCRETQKQINKFDIKLKNVWRNWNIYVPVLFYRCDFLFPHLSFLFFFILKIHFIRLDYRIRICLFISILCKQMRKLWNEKWKAFHHTKTRIKLSVDNESGLKEMESIFGMEMAETNEWNGLNRE